MTLLELLVVIAILAILLGAAIPVLSPADDSRRLREAARGVNTFINGAKVRAKETGRLIGVAFKKLSQDTGRGNPADPNDNGVCLEMYYVEQPPPYAGFDDNARVMLSYRIESNAYIRETINVRFVTTGNTANDNLPPGYDLDPLPTLFRFGDRISVGDLLLQFTDEESERDSQGYYIDTDSTLRTKVVSGNEGLNLGDTSNVDATNVKRTYRWHSINPVYNDAGERLLDGGDTNNTRFWTEPLRYKILRQPVKTSSQPFQLPNKAAIDLEASGFGQGLRLHDTYSDINNADDVIVMFSPEGAMVEAYVNTTAVTGGAQRTPVTSSLFLLVGLRENQPSPQTDFATVDNTPAENEKEKAKINWLNGDARWVVVGAQTGTLATAENASVNPREHMQTPLNNAEWSARRTREINAAREFAREAVGMGGR